MVEQSRLPFLKQKVEDGVSIFQIIQIFDAVTCCAPFFDFNADSLQACGARWRLKKVNSLIPTVAKSLLARK